MLRPLPAESKAEPAASRPTTQRTALCPGYFSLVMATGIVSLSAHFHHLGAIAVGLLWLNVSVYSLLWVLTLVRLVRFPIQFLSELTHHARGATFLTMTAGTCVLGSQFALLTPWMSVARMLWLLGTGLWLVLSYTFFAAMTVSKQKPPLEAGISGAWLLVIVATESISVLGTLVATAPGSKEALLFIALTTYLVGAMLYVFFATLILYRWMFFPMTPDRLTPDYWIDMGALAITALAGALLFQASGQCKLTQGLAPVLAGSTLFFWATGTWWIPLLLIVELWRHVCGRVALKYSPDYWSLVFPLGMYSAATELLGRVTTLKFLDCAAEGTFYVALLAWGITAAGLVHQLMRGFRQSRWIPERTPHAWSG